MGLQVVMPRAEQALRHLAISLIHACPDMRQMAREVAICILDKHGHPELDPDQVFLNRFNTAQSSPRTFSGWEHNDAPFQSFTLPQLVMQRFDIGAQDNSDLLGYLSGFYTQGIGADVYDEHNEVRLMPQAVLEDFWQIDFSQQFHQRLSAFWARYALDYRLLTKVNFLSKVVEVCALDSKSALAVHARRVARALTGHDIARPSLSRLHEEHTPEAGFRLCSFDIGGHVASDILRIETDDGQQLLYTPGEVEALHLFASRKDLYWWVLNTTNQADNRARFMGHFALSSHAEQSSSAGLNHMIDLLFFNWGGDDHQCLNQLDQTISSDAFSHLRDAARERMNNDAHFALRSNSDLRKQLWIGYLQAFGKAFGPLAALDWPIALAAVGAGLADTGLNIDQAINGHTTGERHAAVVGAIFAGIDTLFNAATLVAASAGGLEAEGNELLEPVTEPASPTTESTPSETADIASMQDIEAWVPAPFRPSAMDEMLEPFETNVLMTGKPGEGNLAGIYVQDGNFYALVNEQPYQVRHVAEMDSWVIIDPKNPYSFYRHVPIRMAADGQWQPVPRAGLQGGGIPRALLNLWGRRTSAANLAPLPASPYEVPPDLRPALERAANYPGQNRVLSGIMMDTDPKLESAFTEFRQLRDTLASDAQTYLASVRPPVQPAVTHLPREASTKQIIDSAFANSDGLVIGESHSQLGSKQFLIDNMPLLSKAKVKVLYLEHFMTDFQQAGLDLFQQSGRMPADLKAYVKRLDDGFRIDQKGRYSFENLLSTARKEGIRLQSIDCMASYRQAWDNPPSTVIRQQMMNFYAHEIIEADQALRGASKWVALVGNTHASTFEGVLGIGELEGAVSLRVEDIDLGKPGGVEIDPGLAVIEDDGMKVRHVKSRLRLQVPVRAGKLRRGDLESDLRSTGSFTFKTTNDHLELVHRSNNGQLKYTAIVEEGALFYIDQPGWPWISTRRMRSLWELRTTLEHHGLHYIRT